MAALLKYNAHAVNWAKLQPPTSINVHGKFMHKNGSNYLERCL